MSPSQSGLVLLCHSWTLGKVLDATKTCRMFHPGCGSGREALRTGMFDSDREGILWKIAEWVTVLFLAEGTEPGFGENHTSHLSHKTKKDPGSFRFKVPVGSF
ncbi:hypothetical protein E2320_008163 [Naja naja]|nr:hypothetical protein E2320_008163 [Naja naja]